MGILTDNTIRQKCALDSTYSKAERLVRKGAVFHIDMVKASDRSVDFQAQIDGSGDYFYESSIEVTSEEKGFLIRDYSCTCPAAENYAGFCKHLAALAMEINVLEEELREFIETAEIGDSQEVFDDWGGGDENISSDQFWHEEMKQPVQTVQRSQTIATSSGRTFGSGPSMASLGSSKALLDVMAEVTIQERNRFCQQMANGDVELEVTLLLESNAEYIELRIGRSKKYVVKSLPDLAENIRRQRYVRYGKNLEFVHAQSAFARDSLPMVAFLLTVQFPSHHYSYYNMYGSNKRYLELDARMLDEILGLFAGKEILVNDHRYGEKFYMPVKAQNPLLPLLIQAQKGQKQVKLYFPEILLLEGVRNVYICWNDCIYACTQEYCSAMREILRLMCINRTRAERNSHPYYSMYKDRQVLELCEADYASFCSALLPILEKYMDVRLKGINFDKYQIEEGNYSLYFDLEGNDTVVCRAEGSYGEKKHNLMHPAAVNETYRDIKTEYELRTLLDGYLPQRTKDGQQYMLAGEEERLAALVEEGIMRLQELADVYTSESFKKIRVRTMERLSVGLSIKGSLLHISWNAEGMSNEELAAILGAYRRKKKYYRLRNGELLNLGADGIDILADLQEDLHLTKTQWKSGMADVPLYRSMYLDALMKENSEQITVTRDEMFEKLVRQFDEIRSKEYRLPDGIQANFRPYQMEGYQWACALAELGFGGILADDMGLGKTLQMIAYLRSATKDTHLVICPASLVYNWEAEFAKFAPSMRLCLMVGNAEERKALIEDYRNYDVVITSYDLLKRDIDSYADRRFGCEIIDEAQYIKNPSTQAAKSVKAIHSTVRFALTGTPIENRLSELWSIFEYLMPGYLYSYKYFKEHFEENIIQEVQEKEKTALKRLHKMIRPFLLRRLKKDVLKEIPDKVEEIVYSRFAGEQMKLYQATEKKMLMSLKRSSGQEFKENKLQILAEITRLRQICCDPSLLYDNYKGASAKLETCMELIAGAVESGHKILLFSQFATMLGILRDHLNQKEIRTLVLTGSTSKAKRRELVAKFQEGGADVFLISLKAGGTGLNLTAADIVIHYDPWWNVAAQNQATDRAHRIGQESKVTVMKLIARETIEERIVKLQEKKRDLADKIISEENVALSSLTKEELLGLFGE